MRIKNKFVMANHTLRNKLHTLTSTFYLDKY